MSSYQRDELELEADPLLECNSRNNPTTNSGLHSRTGFSSSEDITNDEALTSNTANHDSADNMSTNNNSRERADSLEGLEDIELPGFLQAVSRYFMPKNAQFSENPSSENNNFQTEEVAFKCRSFDEEELRLAEGQQNFSSSSLIGIAKEGGHRVSNVTSSTIQSSDLYSDKASNVSNRNTNISSRMMIHEGAHSMENENNRGSASSGFHMSDGGDQQNVPYMNATHSNERFSHSGNVVFQTHPMGGFEMSGQTHAQQTNEMLSMMIPYFP